MSRFYPLDFIYKNIVLKAKYHNFWFQKFKLFFLFQILSLMSHFDFENFVCFDFCVSLFLPIQFDKFIWTQKLILTARQAHVANRYTHGNDFNSVRWAGMKFGAITKIAADRAKH